MTKEEIKTKWLEELRSGNHHQIKNTLKDQFGNGEYGYCEVTGEPISLKRLDARPIATMTVAAQEKHERRERVHRDD